VYNKKISDQDIKLKKIKLINGAILLVSALFSPQSFSEYLMRVNSPGVIPPLHSNPKTCSSILGSNIRAVDGNYMVDPDGYGGNEPKVAYCLMSAGGFMLYDSFSSNTGTLGNTPEAYNKKGINSFSAIVAAGYAHNLSHINSTTYHISSQYLQMFRSGDKEGPISKSMPAWSSTIRVDMSNEWYVGRSYLTFSGNKKTFESYEARKEVIISGSGTLRISEFGLIWLDAIWVK